MSFLDFVACVDRLFNQYFMVHVILLISGKNMFFFSTFSKRIGNTRWRIRNGEFVWPFMTLTWSIWMMIRRDYKRIDMQVLFSCREYFGFKFSDGDLGRHLHIHGNLLTLNFERVICTLQNQDVEKEHHLKKKNFMTLGIPAVNFQGCLLNLSILYWLWYFKKVYIM